MNDSIFNLTSAPWTIVVLYTAIRFKIFTILADKKLTVEDLAFKCNARAHLLKPLLDACVSLGFLQYKNDTLLNSHASRVYFIEGQPGYIGDLIQLQFDEFDRWRHMYQIIKQGRSTGKSKDKTFENHQTFIKAMNNLGKSGETEALINAIDLSGCKLMVDAGGGSGIYSAAFCQKYPELKSVILDTRQTLDMTEKMIPSSKAREQITLKESDITKESFGENVDIVLLSDVIYDEGFALPILRNAWNCLKQNGILLLRGYYSDPEESGPLFGALFVLNMLVFDPNRKILTISTLEEKVQEIGFTLIKRSALTERSFVVIATKRD